MKHVNYVEDKNYTGIIVTEYDDIITSFIGDINLGCYYL